jgi:hypothetical protein
MGPPSQGLSESESHPGVVVTPGLSDSESVSELQELGGLEPAVRVEDSDSLSPSVMMDRLGLQVRRWSYLPASVHSDASWSRSTVIFAKSPSRRYDLEGAHHAFFLHLWHRDSDFASFIVYCNWQGALSVRRCILAAIEDWKVFALHHRDGAVIMMMSLPTTWVVLVLDVGHDRCQCLCTTNST